MSHIVGEVSRFLLIIDPGDAIKRDLGRIKRRLSAHIGHYSGSDAVPHITLLFADLPTDCEGSLCRGIAQGCIGQAVIHVQLNGIKYFPDKKTIYIEPIETERIDRVREAIVESLMKSLPPLYAKEVKPTEIPHLTIATGLEPTQFNKAWSLLAPHLFKSEINVSHVILRRKDSIPDAEYQFVRAFALQ